MKKHLPILLSLLLFSGGLYAQDRLISGKVISTEDGKPIAGVNVVVKGTSAGTTTDKDGKYTISAKSGDIITFSFVGLTTREIPLSDQTIVDVSMAVYSQQLNKIFVSL